MHTTSRLSRLISSLGMRRTRRAFTILPFLLVAVAWLGYLASEARRGDSGEIAIVSAAGSVGTVAASTAVATITVNDPGDVAADDGKCTLREAIIAANTNTASGAMAGECVAGTPGTDLITFNLGPGTPVIGPATTLPAITEPITIKGNSGGATRIELNGAGAGAGANGLTISAGSSLIQRLVINRFGGDGIQLTGNGFNAVKGCVLGLDSSGTVKRANGVGIAIRGSSDNVIGGTAPGERNVISGNTTDGVLITNSPAAASRNRLLGNFIGTDATGRFDFGNAGFGVNVAGGDLTVIGGTAQEERNVLSGNDGGGVRIGTAAAANNKIIGNFIGTDASGTFPLGNGVIGGGGTAPGVLIEDAPNNFVGGLAAGERNFISNNNQSAGVAITGNTATGNRVLGNSINLNTGLGIDLDNNGVTGNDPLDVDLGPNHRQNSPALSFLSVGSTSTTIFGGLNSLPLKSFRLEFFYSQQCDTSGFGEGQGMFGTLTVNTDINGSASFVTTFNDVVLAYGQAVTATATLLDVSGNPVETSEFSGCLTVTSGGPSSCTATLIPPTKNFRAAGGSVSVEVSIGSSCAWSASSSVPWATIGAGSPGLGSGAVVINVEANTGPNRIGELTIAGKSFYVSQEGPCTSSLNPASQSFAGAGGTGTIEISTGSGCAWTVTNNLPWITVTTASSGSGPSLVDFAVAPNPGPQQRVGMLTVAGQTFIIIQAAPCTASINPTTQTFAPGGGSGSVGVTIGPTCAWTATTNDAWITINSGASGTGNGTVNYAVAANMGPPRTGALNVAGQTLTITQDSNCSATLNPANQTIASAGGNGSVDVTIASGCDWTATTTTPWITITSPVNNTGNGTATYTVTANPGTRRNGSINIAGQTFNVVQDGACTYTLTPTLQQFVVAGGPGTINVSAPGGCAWTATSAADWVMITSGASGTGNGTVSYFVTTNNSDMGRTGTISVGDQTFNVTQDGGCHYTISPTSQNFASAGGSDAISVTTMANCDWQAISSVPWITVSTGILAPGGKTLGREFTPTISKSVTSNSGTGNGTVNYTVAANTGPPRTGTLNIAGNLFTVTQDNGCPITVSPASLSPATVNASYNQQLSQVGGAGSITWSISAGVLPSGMTLDSTSGLLSGTPAVGGMFNFTARATDAGGCYGERAYSLVINCPTLSITPATLGPGSIGTAYSQQLTLTGGSGQINWTVSVGTLPGGLSLNPTSGALTGSPSAAGTFNFTVKALMPANGCFAEQAYTMNVACPNITVSPVTINNPQIGVPYGQTFTQTGGVGTINWSLSSGSLPNGLMLSADGALSGTPVGSGSFPITVRATDANNCFGERAYTLVVTPCPTISITPNALPSGLVGMNYSQTLTAMGGTPGYSFGVSAGMLPGGLSLSQAGVLSGVPNVVGSFSFTVTVTDQNGCTTANSYGVNICAAITVNPATLPNGFTGTPYSQSLTAAGGTAGYNFTSGGILPTGLTLSPTGVLAGTPNTLGTFNFTVTATDQNGCSGSRGYTVVVSGAGLMFYPLPRPIRLLDTRPGETGCDTPGVPVAGGTSQTQTAAGRTCDGILIPANAKALTGNVTSVQSGGGYLTLYPSDAALPTVSNSNYAPNEILNNVFTVGLGAGDGGFKIFVTSTTHVVVDVTGYYAPPGAGGLYFHPLPHPIRLLETRPGEPGCQATGQLLIGGFARTQQARLTCDGVTIPATAAAVVGNATVVNPADAGYLTLYPSNAAQPLISSSNFLAGQILNAPFTAGLGPDGAFTIFSRSTTDLVVDISGYYSPDPVDANGEGLLFTPLPRPVRLLETRAQYNGCYNTGAPLASNSTRTQQALGPCEGVTVAGNAKAIVANATVVFPAGAGYLTFWPSNAAQPLASASNYTAGQVFARHFIAGLGADGSFNIYVRTTTNLLVDVSGFFAP